MKKIFDKEKSSACSNANSLNSVLKKESEFYNKIHFIPEDNEINELKKCARKKDTFSMLKLARYYLLSHEHPNIKKGIFIAKLIPLINKLFYKNKSSVEILTNIYAELSINEYYLYYGKNAQVKKARKYFNESQYSNLGFEKLINANMFIHEQDGQKIDGTSKFKMIENQLIKLSEQDFYYADFLLGKLYFNCSDNKEKCIPHYKKAKEHGFDSIVIREIEENHFHSYVAWTKSDDKKLTYYREEVEDEMIKSILALSKKKYKRDRNDRKIKKTKHIKRVIHLGVVYHFGREVYALAQKYYTGNGVKQNYKKAFKFFNKSSRMLLSPTYVNLDIATCYLYGHGVEQDKQKAKEILKDFILYYAINEQDIQKYLNSSRKPSTLERKQRKVQERRQKLQKAQDLLKECE